MALLVEWKCGYCEGVQMLSSMSQQDMQLCKCSQSSVSVSNERLRAFGKVIVINQITLD